MTASNAQDAPIDPNAFRFFSQSTLVVLTGRLARNLPGLLDYLRNAPDSSIFHHTHQQYLAHHFEKPLVYNDFAEWVSRALQDKRLAERLATVNLLDYVSIGAIRWAFVQRVEQHLAEAGGRLREAPPGDELHFLSARSFIFPTRLVASDVKSFRDALLRVSNSSLYYHFFEARLRLEGPTNDFSNWLRSIGEEQLAARIEALNPYDYTLNELRERIVALAAGENQGGENPGGENTPGGSNR